MYCVYVMSGVNVSNVYYLKVKHLVVKKYNEFVIRKSRAIGISTMVAPWPKNVKYKPVLIHNTRFEVVFNTLY